MSSSMGVRKRLLGIATTKNQTETNSFQVIPQMHKEMEELTNNNDDKESYQ